LAAVVTRGETPTPYSDELKAARLTVGPRLPEHAARMGVSRAARATRRTAWRQEVVVTVRITLR
jgi:hypothetical protein